MVSLSTEVLEADELCWQPFESPFAPSENFWVGSTKDGSRWLTKLRGDFYAFREIAFARLAQRMGWSCQRSLYLRVGPVSHRIFRTTAGSIHAAHELLDEHSPVACCETCPFAPLIGREIRRIEDLADIKIRHIVDWPKSEFAAYLFGGNEPPGRLITKQHEFYIIDSEQMFAGGPTSFETAHWMGRESIPEASGLNMAPEVCGDLLKLSQDELEEALSLPPGINVALKWPIEPLLRQSLAFAHKYMLRSQSPPRMT